MSAATASTQPDQRTYRRRINAWAMYDVASSAFFTTILAAVMPTYYSAVAGATLPSAAIATRNWSLSLSLALLVSALLSPVLGTLSDIVRGKKALLAVFTAIGAIATGLLVLVSTGDWFLASALIVMGRIGAAGANVFYDALLPHVAKEEDQDAVSTRGYALGYLGGGVLLAINVVMINIIPDDVFGFPFEYAGIRLALFSVAFWWIGFTLPLLFQIPEPPAATDKEEAGNNVITRSFTRLWQTLKDIRQYSELFKYLIAFLIYNDGIGTIIGVAVIYGAELGFETTELILALLLVQFVGIPFSFIFGNLPNRSVKIRHYYLAFIVFNVIALPFFGVLGMRMLPENITGAPRPAYVTIDNYRGEGSYLITDFDSAADWETITIAADLIGTETDATYIQTEADNARFDIPFNGQQIELTYAQGAEYGAWAVELNGETLLDDDGEPILIDAYSATPRYDQTEIFTAPESGQQTLSIVATTPNPDSTGTLIAISTATVLPPSRGGNLGFIMLGLLAIQAIAAAFAYLGGGKLLLGLSQSLNTKRSIILSLIIYGMISTWGYFLNSTIEFWFLAWMVGIVQGGSQALSRSLYASMSPAAKSGEFFGLFSVMAKFSAITGPLLFALAVQIFGNSRPAILSLIGLFIIGGYLLTRVDVEAGRKVAQEENQQYANAQ